MFDNRMTKAEIIEAATYQARCHMNACIEIDRLRARAEQAEAQLAEQKQFADDYCKQMRRFSNELALAKAELAGAKSLLVDKTYIRCKADYNRGHLSHANYLNERERAALNPSPAEPKEHAERGET
jgi:multidrug resistance efflux pump